jgi:hypothetical protein
MIGSSRLLSVVVMSGAVVMTLAAGCSVAPSATRQEHIHHLGHGVMPFDLGKTTHIFQMTEEGGIQQVVAKDPKDSDQIMLIQQHLRDEADRFRLGDFADPATLHGEDMPGLKELQDGASQIAITYAPLPAGAEITFATQDLHLVTAVHRWFGAQLSEHGADATYR